MNMRGTVIALTLASLTVLTAPARAGDLGPATARLLTLQYQQTPKDCGDATRPAYMCSGVMLRATTPTTAFDFFSVSPAARANGGVSVSYLRRDAKYAQLAFGRSSGFVFDTGAFDEASGYEPVKVLCTYPVDGASLRRAESGCGDYDLTAAKETFCDRMGVRTAEQWLALYRSDEKYPFGAQCAFDMRASNGQRAEDFYQSIRAEHLLIGEGKFNGADNQENELVVAPWKIRPPYSPAVSAAFYTGPEGITGARINQIQWYRAAHEVLPAIRLTLPQAASDEATFTYEASQQAIYPVWEKDACDRHIRSARWVKRYDTGFRKEIHSLEITPTDCGRATPSARTNNFFNEMVAAHYLDPEWVNNTDNRVDNIAGMRRQLVCLMILARAKQVWLLEPSRPNTSHANSLYTRCNNVTP